ncbi:uncharacterized protein LOC126572392 [Anopheles aquasalis]|uniref:uncharacterized protein LOC126572392 n=1 Tax=Anopheles aquasalis TaxID=42839 RepID=UPI00215ACA2E|nr:uncharacterized protein LOC126572392 [Anopheles aquasalis]
MNADRSIAEEAERIRKMQQGATPGHRLLTRSNTGNGTQNVLLKVLNREHSGYFSTGLNKRSHQQPYQEVPEHLQYCLKDIVPYCFLDGHIFMGLTSCGQFLLSYRLTYDYEDPLMNGLNFLSNHKYELYFWIYRPHVLLSKYFHVCLFDDHGVDEIKSVSITQWKTDSQLLIVHGGNLNEESDSYVTMVRVPKLGCLECRVVRDAQSGGDEERQDILCIGCNMTIHMKYRSTDSGPRFNPKFNLNCPGYVIMSENSFIHTIHVGLVVPEKKIVPSVALSSKYLGKTVHQLAANEQPSKQCVTTAPDRGVINKVPNTAKPNGSQWAAAQQQWKKSELEALRSTPEVEMSIAEQIIADFAEYETDLYESKCSIRSYPTNFDELIITSPSAPTGKRSATAMEAMGEQQQQQQQHAASKVQLMNHQTNTNIELRLEGGGVDCGGSGSYAGSSVESNSTTTNISESPLASSKRSYVTRVDLQSSADDSPRNANMGPRNAGIPFCDIALAASSSTTSTVSLISPSASSSAPSSSSSLRRRLALTDPSYVPNLQQQHQQPCGDVKDNVSSTSFFGTDVDPAAKAYEFSEDNERCEKISAFRKRRLADKKYEFSEEPTSEENIEPFNRLRNQIRARVPAPGYSPSHHHSGGYGDMMPTTHHLHRASPNHGFRSPCGSPVGNRYLRSPPGIRSPSYYRHRSPSGGMYGAAATGGPPKSHYHYQPPQQLPKKMPPLHDPRDYVHFLTSNCGTSGMGLHESSVGGGPGPRTTPDIPKFFLDAIQKMSERKLAGGEQEEAIMNNENNINCDNQLPPSKRTIAGEATIAVTPKLPERPTCSKKIVKIYVEEDDANSVVTTEEDDCISPGYHTSLPMEVHGSCYSNMQIISQASYSKLNCAAVVVTQNSFDMETFSFHVANHICTQDSKKYGILLDSAYELTHVCPLTATITCTMVLQFTANDVNSSKPQQCKSCAGTIDCQTHRKVYQCRSLFTWCVMTGDWAVLDYGSLCTGPYLNMQKLASNYNRLLKKLRKFTKKLFANGGESEASDRTYEFLHHLRVHDSDVSKTKERLVDLENMIEFYRRHPGECNDDQFSNSDLDSYGEEEENDEEEEEEEDGDSSADDSYTVIGGTSIASDTVSDEDDL